MSRAPGPRFPRTPAAEGAAMTRIDLSTREWHELIKPVIPHALKDADYPQLEVVRIEAAERAVYAIATDRYTLGAERHELPERLWEIPAPVHMRLAEASASLKLFPYSKDFDPPLRLTIDKAPVPVAVAGHQTAIDHLALT